VTPAPVDPLPVDPASANPAFVNPRLEALARTFREPVSGPTYRPITRVLAATLVAGLLVWGGAGLVADLRMPLDWTRIGASAMVAIALLWPMPSLLFGRTVIDATGIRQPGWYGREATWIQVQRIRYVPMPLSPRLIISIGLGRARVFYSGDPQLDGAFREVVRLLTAPIEELR
jgi:hypothetical protein